MSFISKSIKSLKDISEPFDVRSYPYVVKAFFSIGDSVTARYLIVDNVKHLNSLQEFLRLFDFCNGFAVGTPDTIKQL